MNPEQLGSEPELVVRPTWTHFTSDVAPVLVCGHVVSLTTPRAKGWDGPGGGGGGGGKEKLQW